MLDMVGCFPNYIYEARITQKLWVSKIIQGTWFGFRVLKFLIYKQIKFM